MNLTLYQISEEQQRLNAMLEESGGELTPEIEEALAINRDNLQVKAEGYATSILKYKAMAEMIANESKRLAAMKKTCENICDNMKKRLAKAMQDFEINGIEAGTMKLSLRKSTSVVIDDDLNIPADCIKVETSIDKTKVKEHLKALKEGETIGAHLETNYSLQIR